MRRLASFVMAGRIQAIACALILGLIPLLNLLNPLIVGLVFLRKGGREGLWIFVWAVLPLLGWAIIGDLVPLIMLLGVSGLGLLLRNTGSWQYTLLAAIAVGIGVEIYFQRQPQMLDVLLVQMEAYLRSNAQYSLAMEDVRAALIGAVGAVYMFLAIMLLMWARWIQAALFNQGGFQREFHSLRIEYKAALALLALALLASFELLVPSSWLLYVVLPLVFSGIALVHAVVKYKKLPRLWLLTFYVLLLLPWAVQLLILVALADSWYDFRARMPAS